MAQTTKGTAGVLQIPAAATQKSAPSKKVHKPPAPRLKLLIRRLPPGLTQAELEGALGTEWKVGGGKVDWLQYKPGKVSKDPAKPSRPSRAYVHVVSSEQITPLSEQVRQASFHDARNTFHDPVLLGPPTLEFAPYAKTPGSRVRKDARQGTIDQDPDFIAFLESLTQPITKSAPAEADGNEKKDSVVTTPLVQFIKDKKASKAKDGGGSKSSKGRSDKEPKEKVQAKKVLQRPNKETSTAEPSEKKGKGEKNPKESAKASKQAASASKPGKANASNTAKESGGQERKRERGNATGVNKILQRDLGVSPAGGSGGRRRGKGDSNETDSPNDSTRDSATATLAPDSTKKDQTTKGNKNAGPIKAKESESPQGPDSTPTSNPPAKTPKGTKGKSTAPPSPTATQAFLKHANPSQGVTEALLQEAFGSFGAVSKVEIDKKKGFGYVDFAEPGGLQRAIAASPVAVAQSQVVVLERKANAAGEKSRKGRNDPQASGKAKAAPSDGTSPAPAASTTGSSSRGPRGRGSRNKGPKGGGSGGGNTGSTDKAEKPKDGETK
ncbi:hypothetical protein N7470_003316 [Penicillium chermesinum]|nr:hypothetical protein N7470_003316 [Penicillium chermesinum]